jgi:hypothetical protein
MTTDELIQIAKTRGIRSAGGGFMSVNDIERFVEAFTAAKGNVDVTWSDVLFWDLHGRINTASKDAK